MQAKEIIENVRTIIKYNYKYRNGIATVAIILENDDIASYAWNEGIMHDFNAEVKENS